MDTVTLSRLDNQRFNADVIRYFKLMEKNYLIFSLNEIDEQGYLKLYAIRVEEKDSVIKGYNLLDDEWNEVKNYFHIIVNNNRNGIPNINDLRVDGINGMLVIDYKPFKLKKDTAKELADNKNFSIQNSENHDIIQESGNLSINNNNSIGSQSNMQQYKSDFMSKNVPQLDSNRITGNIQSSQDQTLYYEQKINELSKENESLKNENMIVKQELKQLKDKITTAIGDLSQLNL